MVGGGFAMEPDNPLLGDYILGLSQAAKPKVCFIPTASGDSDKFIVRFYSAFIQRACVPAHLSLFNPPTADLRAFILEQDILYVGGGNTKNLLVLWKEWGLDQVLREAWLEGRVLAGLSAGSICWFEQGVTDSIPGSLSVLDCLGFLKGSNCPHYDGEAKRKPAYHQLLSTGQISSGYATEDGVGLHFVGDKLEKIISSRPHAKAFWLERTGETVIEEPLASIYLGDGKP